MVVMNDNIGDIVAAGGIFAVLFYIFLFIAAVLALFMPFSGSGTK
jgi:hypothetical protein